MLFVCGVLSFTILNKEYSQPCGHTYMCVYLELHSVTVLRSSLLLWLMPKEGLPLVNVNLVFARIEESG